MLHGTRNLPRSGIEPVSPALAGRFLTTRLPGKSVSSSVLAKRQFVQEKLESIAGTQRLQFTLLLWAAPTSCLLLLSCTLNPETRFTTPQLVRFHSPPSSCSCLFLFPQPEMRTSMPSPGEGQHIRGAYLSIFAEEVLQICRPSCGRQSTDP